MKDFGSQCPKGSSYTDRVVFEEQVAPLVLDIEEEREHDDDVDHRDEGHDDKTTVHDQNSQLLNIFWKLFYLKEKLSNHKMEQIATSEGWMGARIISGEMNGQPYISRDFLSRLYFICPILFCFEHLHLN